MHHRVFGGAAALALAFGLAGQPLLAAEQSSPPLPSALTVHLKNFTFVPTAATIHAGDRVTFVNDDDEAHTATSENKAFDSEGLDSGQRWQHVFAQPGTIRYFCELHPYMKATLTVLPAAPAARR